MQISGPGSGSFDSGDGRGSRSRSASFKKGRRIGQKVRGTLIKWVSEDMAWVNIDGHRLLAQLQSRPPVGARLTFVIKQLQPNIILKELYEVPESAANTISMANDFDTARTLFENQFRPHAKLMLNAPPEQRQKTFVSLLRDNTKIMSSFLDAVACLHSIQIHIGIDKGMLHYSPWMAPTARRHVGLLRKPVTMSDGNLMTEAIEECEYTSLGMVRAEFLQGEEGTSYRLKVQHVKHSNDLKRYLTTRNHQWISGKLKYLGTAKLPRGKHGGLIAELVFGH